MLDFEDRIRAEVTRQADAYVPPADLPERITARVTRRRATRRVTLAGIAAAVLVMVGVAGALAVSSGADRTDTAPADTPGTGPAPTTGASAPTTTGPTPPTSAPAPGEGADTTAPSTSTTPTTGEPAPTTSTVAPPPLAGGTPLACRRGQRLRRCGARCRGRTPAGDDHPRRTARPGRDVHHGARRGDRLRAHGRAQRRPGCRSHHGHHPAGQGGDRRRRGHHARRQGRGRVRHVRASDRDRVLLRQLVRDVRRGGRVRLRGDIDATGRVIELASGFPVVYPEG